MRVIALIILLCQTQAKETVVADQSSDMHDAMESAGLDEMADKLVMKLIERALTVHDADLDDATLAKLHPTMNRATYTGLSGARSSFPVPGSSLPIPTSRLLNPRSLPLSHARQSEAEMAAFDGAAAVPAPAYTRRTAAAMAVAAALGAGTAKAAPPKPDRVNFQKTAPLTTTKLYKSGDDKSYPLGGVGVFPQGDKYNIVYDIGGLTPGKHGFHIHAKGDLGDACKNAGPHFNPNNKLVGELGNIVADKKGIAKGNILSDLLTFTGSDSIIGKSFIVHSDEEVDGNSGPRFACGIIEKFEKPKSFPGLYTFDDDGNFNLGGSS